MSVQVHFGFKNCVYMLDYATLSNPSRSDPQRQIHLYAISDKCSHVSALLSLNTYRADSTRIVRIPVHILSSCFVIVSSKVISVYTR